MLLFDKSDVEQRTCSFQIRVESGGNPQLVLVPFIIRESCLISISGKGIAAVANRPAPPAYRRMAVTLGE